MQVHWAKIPDGDEEPSFVITDGDHPTDCGEPGNGFQYKRLSRAPREHETFRGGRLRPRDPVAQSDPLRERINAMVDDRLREHGLIE